MSAQLANMQQIVPDPEIYAKLRADLIDIYRRPRFGTLEAQESAVAQARDLAHAQCIREAHFSLSR
jgi:hypothetical protein